MDARYVSGPEEDDIQHPPVHFTEKAPQEEGACFSASLGSRELLPAPGREAAFAGASSSARPGRCCPLGAVGAALELRAGIAGAAAQHTQLRGTGSNPDTRDWRTGMRPRHCSPNLLPAAGTCLGTLELLI